MTVYARVAGGLVAELVEIEAEGPPLAELFHPDFVATMVALPEGSEVAEGWTWDGEAFAPPPPPEPVAPVVPATISRRQMLLALVAGEVITAAEAWEAATVGAVPAAIDAVFAALPDADALAARITFATMIEVERAHPLIGAMIAAELVTEAEADSLFVLAATL
ncbi:hypothetical protein GXW78_26885 [Roseomonas terrae]|uniref:DUF4376 domain-containing protein n=1 Tax=Neoroseomonas terrae TaxID=424799 RepID=A0ABS5EQK7_9PROT|nr:hypothetical protein [Neoroseomonas terrae]MBR0653308.1 hypothetical protein [Neoroseomonas terrae]